ncbi:MAG: hypothetical protein E6J91_32320 [Deltaproteobacteria bacterium]|nr:MAG: hypothetical protein E6J91_32320 [Deltaproteobacteria bacterium]
MDQPAEVRARFDAVLGEPVELSRREDRWLALGADVIGFAAVDARGWARLVAEGRLLVRWRAAGVPAPRVLDERAALRVQVRDRLHGLTGEAIEPLLFGGAPPDARGRFADDAPLSRFGARLAASYGELAAQIHAAAALRDDPSVTAATIEAVARAMPWLAATPPATAVIHGDLHFHNLCLSADGTITGVFDLGDAGGDAPEADLQYAHSLGPRFVAVAVHAYRRPLDMNAIRRAHLRTALTHILWHGPGTPRHRSIVAWIEAAFAALAIGP